MNDTSHRYTVAALYRFVALPEFADLQAPLHARMLELNISGTLLLAAEGINGTVAGDNESVTALITFLREAPLWQGRLQELGVKISFAAKQPFTRCKVKLKKEIVTMGVSGIDPNQSAGTYVKPADWNALISDPDVITIDTRNDYEVQIGTFKGAINPHTSTFRDFPGYAQRELDPQKHKKIAMYCTGGIRCEKSTAYMKSLGFDEVYHLQGGILKYLEEVPQENSLWEGECFVFDERIAVDHDLQPGSYKQCHACRMPLNEADLQHAHYVQGESCSYCYANTSAEQRASFRERQKQVLLAKQRGEKHIGGSVDASNARRHAEKLAVKDKLRSKP